MPKNSTLTGKNWNNSPHFTTPKSLLAHLWDFFNLSDPVQQKAFINPTEKPEYHPKTLQDIHKASERIQKAIKNQEKILIYGDFDTDGIMSTTLLVHSLRRLGAKVSYRIPERVKESHGLNKTRVLEAKELGVTLIITCDCATNDIQEVNLADQHDIDIIITDHHESDPERFPKKAYAVINPQRKDDLYPFKPIAGVLVAFKVVQYLVSRVFSTTIEQEAFLQPYYELVAVGTVADCMPLIKENQYMVKKGLKYMKNSAWPALKQLLEGKETFIKAETISFSVAPMLNAASRLGDVRQAVKLFLGKPENIPHLLQNLDYLNDKRKRLTQHFLSTAEKIKEPNQICQILLLPDCPVGICGLVAGKIAETSQKPVAVVTLLEDNITLSASCRGPKGSHWAKTLKKTEQYLIHFGGHDQAAGFRLQKQHFQAFKDQIQKEYATFIATPESQDVFTFIESPKIANKDVLKALYSLEPFGIGRKAPLFGMKDVNIVYTKRIGAEKNHLKLECQKNNEVFTVCAFFKTDWEYFFQENQTVDLLFNINQSVFRNKAKMDFFLVDARG